MSVPILPKLDILGARITNASRQQILEDIANLAMQRRSAYVCFSNVHMVIEAYFNHPFREVLNQSEIAAPDGKPLSVLMNILYGTRQQRAAGPDIMVSLLQLAEAQNLAVYFYGSTPDVLAALTEKLAVEYPRLKLAGMYSPPFRALSAEEQQDIRSTIIASGAQIVFVGLGCPKQEQWMSQEYGKIPAVMLGVGAAFPFYTGHLSRCPQWMQTCGLEWLYRLLAEPRRLFARYFYTNSWFLGLALKEIVWRKCLRRPAPTNR